MGKKIKCYCCKPNSKIKSEDTSGGIGLKNNDSCPTTSVVGITLNKNRPTKSCNMVRPSCLGQAGDKKRNLVSSNIDEFFLL